MSQMPEIKPVVNKEPERDNKKAGLLARLFGGGASGGGAGLGGVGGGGMGGLAGGGILATKAGVLALVLVGTTVAGGIGMVGYRLFGPGAEMTGNGDNLQLFASKPKENASADGQGAAKGDGNSASLQYLSQANTTPKEGDAAAAGATKDATAGSATSVDAASAGAAGGANGPLNASGSSGNGVSHAMLKNTGKFGALSGPNSGGGGTSAVASAAPQKAPAFDPNAATKGSLSGFKKTAAASIHGGTARTLAGRHFNGAVGQGFGVLGNQKGAQSSYAAGQTYDGAAAGGSNIGNNGTPIGGPGAAAGGGPAQPKSIPGPATDQNNSQNIPTPPATPMAPWQSAIKTAEVLLALGGVILFLLSKIPPTHKWLFYGLAALVMAMGAMIVGLGAAIGNGKYGQKLQGGVLAAAGAGLTIAAIMAMATGPSSQDTTTSTTTKTTGSETSAAGKTTTTTTSNSDSGSIMGMSPYVLLGGGSALIGLAGAMMIPPKTYPAGDFNGKPPPDIHLWGYQEMPSETALKKMIA